MPKYGVLLNYTEQGIKNIRDTPAFRRAQMDRMAAMGITREYYLTMGQYDAVAIADAPDDETLARFLLTLGGSGSVRTTTMRAFTEDETDQIIGSMPPAG